MSITTINGQDIYYEETGKGTPIIFVHGLGIDSNIFFYQTSYFKNKYRLINYDLRGHGKSSAPETGYSYNDFAADLKALIEHLGLKDFHLVGLSMGGAIAARYVLENPGNARSICFIGSHLVGYYKFENWPNIYKIARVEGVDKARQTWKDFRLFETVKKDHDKYQRLSEMVDNFSCAIWLDPNPRYDEINDLKRLSEINIPSMITTGLDDSDFGPIADILKEEIPENVFKQFGSGHLLSYEQPEEFNKVYDSFLASIE
jgi:pimeloyl-ACP methyl ester carboxylesterase